MVTLYPCSWCCSCRTVALLKENLGWQTVALQFHPYKKLYIIYVYFAQEVAHSFGLLKRIKKYILYIFSYEKIPERFYYMYRYCFTTKKVKYVDCLNYFYQFNIWKFIYLKDVYITCQCKCQRMDHKDQGRSETMDRILQLQQIQSSQVSGTSSQESGP